MNHDWKPIDSDDDPSEMCTACLQCKCCETPTPDCPGAWVDEYGNPEDEVKYIASETVLTVARRISEENAELMRRLGGN